MASPRPASGLQLTESACRLLETTLPALPLPAESIHLANHHLGGDPNYTADPEWWTEMITGKTWGITARGTGPIFLEAGDYRYKLTVTDQTPGDEILECEEPRPWKGKSTFDAVGPCEYLGYDYVEP